MYSTVQYTTVQYTTVQYSTVMVTHAGGCPGVYKAVQRKRLNILSQKSLGPNGLKIDDSRVYNKMLYFHVAGNYGLFPANYVEIIDNKELQVM